MVELVDERYIAVIDQIIISQNINIADWSVDIIRSDGLSKIRVSLENLYAVKFQSPTINGWHLSKFQELYLLMLRPNIGQGPYVLLFRRKSVEPKSELEAKIVYDVDLYLDVVRKYYEANIAPKL